MLCSGVFETGRRCMSVMSVRGLVLAKKPLLLCRLFSGGCKYTARFFCHCMDSWSKGNVKEGWSNLNSCFFCTRWIGTVWVGVIKGWELEIPGCPMRGLTLLPSKQSARMFPKVMSFFSLLIILYRKRSPPLMSAVFPYRWQMCVDISSFLLWPAGMQILWSLGDIASSPSC